MADESNYTNAPTSSSNWLGEHEYLGHVSKATDLMGQPLKNEENETLGKIKDLAVDLESGRIVFAVVSSGGMLGMGADYSAVPPGILHQDYSNQVVYVDASKARLAESKIDLDRWTDTCGTNRVAELYSSYDQTAYFLPASQQSDTNLMTPRQLGQLNNNQPMRGAGENLGYVERASKIIGLPVLDIHAENVGKVSDLTVNLRAGRIVALVIASGDNVGINSDLVLMPPGALHFNADTNALQLNVSKEVLAVAPHFPANAWPDLSEPGYNISVYRAYSVEPFFSSVAGEDANENTNSRSLTPLDQGNSQADINITAKIRQQVVARTDFSIEARNVIIITRNGWVTLRGVVNTPEEKRQIADIANNVAGADHVDNQIEVKLSTASNSK